MNKQDRAFLTGAVVWLATLICEPDNLVVQVIIGIATVLYTLSWLFKKD